MPEDVEVIFKEAGTSRRYTLQTRGAHTAEMIVQLLNLGDVDSLRLEPVRLALSSRIRSKARVGVEHFGGSECRG